MKRRARISAYAWRRALALLREAVGAINDELNAAGPDADEHPIMRAHARTSDRIKKFLDSHGIKPGQKS